MTSSIFEKANARHYRPGALEASLRDGRSYDADLARAFETGEAHTRRASMGPGKLPGRKFSRFIPRGPRQYPVSPDREASRQRRRTWGGSSVLPDNLRRYYTEGERAALAVIVAEVKKHSRCDLPIDAIAAAAGVSRTTVQNAVRKARSEDLGHISVERRPRPGQKNLTNVIRIISRVWLTWLKRSIGFKILYPSKTHELKKHHSKNEAASQKAYEREKADSVGAKGSEGDCGESRLDRLKREAADMDRRQRVLANISRHLGEDEPVRNGHEGPMIDLERGEFARGNPCRTGLPAMMGGARGWSPTFGS